jgi:threonine/homoserine/homoserine lactone efflux protein
MVFVFLLKGIAIGFSLAVPIGPIGILCIRRTLARGSSRGFVIGLSGASADVVYALVAAFGVSLISEFVSVHQEWMRLAGGVLLLALGFHLVRTKPDTHAPTKRIKGETSVYVSTFFLALTNPMTLFAYAAAFSAIGVEGILGEYASLGFLVAGVFLGALLWFSLLTGLSHLFKKRITTGGLNVVNKVAGSLLMAFGLVGLWLGLRAF